MSIVMETEQNNQTNLQDMLESIEELPSIPETLIAILKVIDDPNSGPADLAEVVRLDAPLMAKVLRLANSPYYSSRSEMADIGRCVSVLGYRTVRQVAICVTVATSVVTAVAKSRGRLDYRELWRHSVATAAISKHLAKMVKYPDPEEIFTAALLHDMGKFVLEIHAPETYDKIIKERAETHESLVVVEDRYFGFNHASIGEAFGQSWRFPEILTRCFGGHHDVGTADRTVDKQDIAKAIVGLGDYLANTMEPPRSDLGFDPRNVDVAAVHGGAGISIVDVEENLEEIRESISRASAFLDL